MEGRTKPGGALPSTTYQMTDEGLEQTGGPDAEGQHQRLAAPLADELCKPKSKTSKGRKPSPQVKSRRAR